MRYYLISEESQDEFKIDLIKSKKISDSMMEFRFLRESINEPDDEVKLYIKKIAGKYFGSNDKIHWKRIVKQKTITKLINQNQVYSLYRGYRPSKGQAEVESSLVTKMPGKMAQIFVKKGEAIRKGDKLFILEAMKMENEVRSGQDGVVSNIFVKEGQPIDQGVKVMELTKS